MPQCRAWYLYSSTLQRPFELVKTLGRTTCVVPDCSIMDDILNERAKQFVIQAAISALISIELCLIASEKASLRATRDLARTALDAHCDIANAVVETALRHRLAIPSQFDVEHKENMHVLLSAQGEEFDRAFIETLIRENETAFFFHAGEAIQGTNSRIEAITSRALPLLEQQLSALRSIFPSEG